jgi:uncharacterized protein (DUF952 family)
VTKVYKILTLDEWTEAEPLGRFEGGAADLRDGFIHFSTAQQVEGTLERHFGGVAAAMVLTLDAGRLAPHLRWEPSRGGALFPHLYAPLDLSLVEGRRLVQADGDGRLAVGDLEP